jgi:UDP-N-acetylmuramyl pentapeptide phosphotransferase/UDP-N-acetylglucosamine-1-phosphate transferase
MRTRHIIAGTVALGLGLAGIYDEYFVVVEFLKGIAQPLTALVGIIAVISGISRRKGPDRRLGSGTIHIVFGLVLLGVAVYGFYDEYYAVMDFLKGSLPIVLIGVGTVAVFSGINRLRVTNS